jgi:hypothetical protein
MGQAIGQVLPLAVGVALSPMPIIAVVFDARDGARAAQRAGVRDRLARWTGNRRAIALAIADPAGATRGASPQRGATC